MTLRRTRLLKELKQLQSFNHDGIKLKDYCDDSMGGSKSERLGDIDSLEFEMVGPEDTPFAKAVLHVEIKLTKR